VTRAALLVLVLLAGCGAVASGADFTHASSSPGNVLASAADFNTVAVAITDPGAPLRGTVTLQATASSDRGIDRVRFQSSPAGAGAWTDACEDTAAPYSCDWDSAGVADGSRDLRAVAVDQAGYQRVATVSARLVDNTLPGAALGDPGVMTGTATLTATASDGGSGLATLSIAYRPAGGSWTTLCSGATSPRSCALDTTTLTDGSYELRARATDAAGNVRDDLLTRTADNTAPTVAVVAPGPLRGTATISATAADGTGTGVASVTLQMRPVGGSWSQLCADTTAPYQCSVNTTTLTDGLYELRATAADGAGLSTTSAVVTNVRVDNTVPAVPTLTNPGTPLQGNVALTGTATDGGSGIASWTVQSRPSGGSTWSDACTDTTAPFGSCTWATAALTDGLYDVRAVAVDAAGNQTASTPITSRRVDNVAPTVSLTDPGSPIRGTVTLNATASDGGGVASVVFERAPAGGSTWTAICTDTTAPYSCAFNTAGVADGSYDLRARATDNASRQTTSVVSARSIDNTAPAASAVDAGNGGATPGRLESGDWLRLTWSEPIAPASILAGWDGSPLAIRVELQNVASKDLLDFWNSTGTTRLNLVDSNVDLTLNTNFIATSGWFNATMTRSGGAITITFGSLISGTLVTASAAHIVWAPSILATDLAGNPSAATSVTEPNPKDLDF
jgi:chitinase